MDIIHGGDVTGYRRRYSREPLDFSASLNPCGIPPSVLAAATAALERSTPYPDPLCRDLTAALAECLGVGEERIVLGNGAADVLYRLVLALTPRSAAIPVPSFAEYEHALSLVGCDIRVFPAAADCVFLCQPNNPTGTAVPQGILDDILASGATLILDECFQAFMDEPRSLRDRIQSCGNLVILDSFTKLYAMAGIRLGYALFGDAELAEKTRRAGPPWQVSTVAQAAGLAALADTDYVEKSLAAIREWKKELVYGLSARGCAVLGAEANFVFFRTDRVDLGAGLAERGILIRDCANFRGLEPGYFRVAVRTAAENAALLQAIDEVTGA